VEAFLFFIYFLFILYTAAGVDAQRRWKLSQHAQGLKGGQGDTEGRSRQRDVDGREGEEGAVPPLDVYSSVTAVIEVVLSFFFVL
jgi:hypothetical protein